MKIFKLGLILSLLAVFIFACTQNAATGGNANVTTTNGTVIVSSSPNVSYNSANTANAPSGNDELASAAKIYSEKCVKCHKEDGTGGETVIEGTRIKAPNFTSDKHKHDKDSEWVDTIENGAKEDGMPAFKGKLSDDEIKNLIKYIHKNFQGM
ncbi:MAG: c-type cytochrome [Pyrinomonadaceae bacterium]